MCCTTQGWHDTTGRGKAQTESTDTQPRTCLVLERLMPACQAGYLPNALRLVLWFSWVEVGLWCWCGTRRRGQGLHACCSVLCCMQVLPCHVRSVQWHFQPGYCSENLWAASACTAARKWYRIFRLPQRVRLLCEVRLICCRRC
jgi:hypothetical protein